MAKPTLAQIRAQMKADEEAANSYKTGSNDNTLYVHWNIGDGQTAQVRFLPDADEDNMYYWIERLMINLPFSGIKGQPNSKPCKVKVPCMEMWEPTGSCPVLAEVRPWFKMNDKAMEDMARKYWKKKSYIMQGFVHDDPSDEEETPDNPIRKFLFTPQIFGLVKAALSDPELEETPTDYEQGLDFFISKTPGNSGYSEYITSKYSRKETALTQDELDAIEEFGLNDLKAWLPEKPDEKHLEIIMEMFEASVDGEPYDPERWGEYYRAPGMTAPTTPTAENAGDADDKAEEKAPAAEKPASTKKKVTPKKTKAPEPKEEDDSDDGDDASSDKAKNILKMIRDRNK